MVIASTTARAPPGGPTGIKKHFCMFNRSADARSHSANNSNASRSCLSESRNATPTSSANAHNRELAIVRMSSAAPWGPTQHRRVSPKGDTPA